MCVVSSMWVIVNKTTKCEKCHGEIGPNVRRFNLLKCLQFTAGFR